LSTNRRAVEFSVCDGGLGIPRTLREGHPKLRSDAEALDLAIREGITRNAWHGQGYGLYDSYRIAHLTEGHFEIQSGYASLFYSPKTGLHVKNETIPFNGTLVSASIRYDQPLALEEALKFKGKLYTPVDFIELSYDEDEVGNVPFKISDESDGFGTRSAGLPVRNKLNNLLSMVSGKIIIYFESVVLISSSYADEVFGKVFAEIGPIDFSGRFEFRHMDNLIKNIIDRSISQRMQAS
jgi:hypothetical protein